MIANEISERKADGLYVRRQAQQITVVAADDTRQLYKRQSEFRLRLKNGALFIAEAKIPKDDLESILKMCCCIPFLVYLFDHACKKMIRISTSNQSAVIQNTYVPEYALLVTHLSDPLFLLIRTTIVCRTN